MMMRSAQHCECLSSKHTSRLYVSHVRKTGEPQQARGCSIRQAYMLAGLCLATNSTHACAVMQSLVEYFAALRFVCMTDVHITVFAHCLYVHTLRISSPAGATCTAAPHRTASTQRHIQARERAVAASRAQVRARSDRSCAKRIESRCARRDVLPARILRRASNSQSTVHVRFREMMNTSSWNGAA